MDPIAARDISLHINGNPTELRVEPRTSLLDALRENLGLTGTKKGCNQGACGACTVLVDGERIVSCLTLAVQHDGREVTTIEGIADGASRHPLQDALRRATTGSSAATARRVRSARPSACSPSTARGMPSHVSERVSGPVELTRAEIAERMSGNLCRCGAYNGIVDAITEVASGARP